MMFYDLQKDAKLILKLPYYDFGPQTLFKMLGENGVSGPWGKWSEIKLFVQIQAHCPLLITFFTIEI